MSAAEAAALDRAARPAGQRAVGPDRAPARAATTPRWRRSSTRCARHERTGRIRRPGAHHRAGQAARSRRWSSSHDRPHRHAVLLRRHAADHVSRARRAPIGPDVIDIRTLYGKTGKFTYDPGFLSTASCNSAITYIDGDKGELLYRGYPIEELAMKCDFLETCYLLLYGELPNKAAEGRLRRPRHASHDGQRADAVLPARLPPRRAPDGGADRPRRRAVGVLSRLDEPARPAAARHLGDPPDRQDAHAGGDGLQVLDRPAVHLPAQRAHRTPATSCA